VTDAFGGGSRSTHSSAEQVKKSPRRAVSPLLSALRTGINRNRQISIFKNHFKNHLGIIISPVFDLTDFHD
jgi:hypothetical protein